MFTYAGIDAAVGTHLGFSPWRTVDQKDITEFAVLSGDEQWIHVDPERAARGPFGATVAHGFFTLSLIVPLTEPLFDVEDSSMSVNYGLNKVRFPSPVRVGASIRAGAELVEVTRSSDRVQVVLRVTVEVEGNDRPAVVADWVLLVFP